MNCPVCNTPVSNEHTCCPKCGTPLSTWLKDSEKILFSSRDPDKSTIKITKTTKIINSPLNYSLNSETNPNRTTNKHTISFQKTVNLDDHHQKKSGGNLSNDAKKALLACSVALSIFIIMLFLIFSNNSLSKTNEPTTEEHYTEEASFIIPSEEDLFDTQNCELYEILVNKNIEEDVSSLPMNEEDIDYSGVTSRAILYNAIIPSSGITVYSDSEFLINLTNFICVQDSQTSTPYFEVNILPYMEKKYEIRLNSVSFDNTEVAECSFKRIGTAPVEITFSHPDFISIEDFSKITLNLSLYNTETNTIVSNTNVRIY